MYILALTCVAHVHASWILIFLHRLSQKYLFFYFVLLNPTIQSGKLNESVILGFLVLNLILKENKSCVFIN